MTDTPGTEAGPSQALAVGQRLLWMYGHYQAQEPLHIPPIFEFVGDLDVEALERALDVAVNRHEALRTTYGGRARQVHEHLDIPLERVDAGTGPLDAVLLEQVMRPIDLTVRPLRAVLLRVDARTAVLLLVIHHLSTDGWSGGVLSRDLQRAYRDVVDGTGAATQPPTWQLSDFVAWQDRHLSGPQIGADQEFWRELLRGARVPTLESGAGDAEGHGTLGFTLPYEEFSGLARTHRASPFALGFALFVASLRRLGAGRDVAVSTMFANRVRPELDETVGFLANLAVLRVILPETATFADVLTACRDVVLDALDHQQTPYHLVPRPDGERDADLETVMFQISAGPAYDLSLPGCEVRQLDSPTGLPSRFDLEFDLIPEQDCVRGILFHRRSRLSDEGAQRLVSEYLDLCRLAHADPRHAI